jgi:hypothetical protein
MESKQFAWWPTKVTSGKLIWLKYYFQHKERFDINTGRPPLSSLYFTWTETPAEKTLRLLKESAVHNRNIWNDPLLTKQDTL